MASFNNPNQSPNAFWEHVASTLDDHPFFNPRSVNSSHPPPPPPPPPAAFWGWGNPHHSHRRHRGPPPSFWAWAHQTDDEDQPHSPETHDSAANQPAETTAGPSHSAEEAHNTEKGPAPSSDSEPQSQHEGRPHGRCGKDKHPSHGGHHGSSDRGRCGRGSRGGRGRHHGHGRPPFGAGPGLPNMDFLRNIASQFGVQFNEPTPDGVDFVPSLDMFDTPTTYIVHVSLPGAKKEDLSVDYDPEESVLRLAGVTYRPGINEDLYEALVMKERAREVGVFQRDVHVGTSEAPADILVDEIKARLEDGVLIVTLPKVQRAPQAKKKIVVEDGSTTVEKYAAERENISNEKDAMLVDVKETETASETLTPSASDDESEGEGGENKEYVKVQVN
ncbi:hypothetical protein N7539_002547 [Penicillium diatomitis]|uniref:SHSP domain-containing protein n=1 Tax=Penicillium diatomitis TaxID=2819901 RepID=A0A9W9XEW1_9EURO|nr:uncharacterized protein N7539_002547 [Penicillium diatomitis]KAJ5490980.1 hypothetical protein N7539_002547 [Penicillium diatomitis]